MYVLLLSMLQACGDKSEDTAKEDSEEESETSAQNARFEYECYNNADEGLYCSRESSEAILSDSEFRSYLVDGELTEDSCTSLCTAELEMYMDYLCSCEYQGVDSNGDHPVTCEYTICAVEGRTHADIKKLQRTTGHTELGQYFARAYHAEASSVAAFLQLRKELAFHNAPIELQKRCLLAAKEEIMHAQMMNILLEQHQGERPSLDFGHFEPRSLLDLAIDNAVEGCIFETFSALRVFHQSQQATDTVIAKTMRTIALDEIRHAELSWDIHRYLMTVLSPEDKVILAQKQEEAVQALLQSPSLPSIFSAETKSKIGLKDLTDLRRAFSNQWTSLAA